MSERVHRTLLGALLVGATGLLCTGCPSQNGEGNPANVATSGVALTAQDVDRILAAAVREADLLGQAAAIAVVGRDGEVLGVFVMNGRDVNRDGTIDAPGDANVATAISKAATAAAFQSEGEAFTTRTAYFIVQGNFPPLIHNTPAGPLFGVQDSGMPSSDAHIVAYDQNGNGVGAGISGEFGGVPLYKQGAPVGGIGVDAVTPLRNVPGLGNGVAPTLDGNIQHDFDEQIARAGVGAEFEAPGTIQAGNVYVDGIALPFYGNTANTFSTTAPVLSTLPASLGAVDSRFPVRASPLPPEVRAGGEYGLRSQHRYLGRVGARASTSFVGSGAFVQIDRPAGVTFDPNTLTFTTVPIQPLAQRSVAGGPGEDRFPAVDSLEPPPAEGGLTRAEVEAIVGAAVRDARTSVAGIRLPRGSHVTLHVAVVDRRGNLLALHRMADGTLFSADIAVQKARTCAYFSSDGSEGLPPVAWSARGIGFLAQPYFPPGIPSTHPGPLVGLRDLVNRGKIVQEIPPSYSLISPPPRLPSDGTTDENPVEGGNQTFDDYPGAAPAELAAVRAILSATGGISLFQDRPDTTPQFVSPGLQSGLMTFAGAVPLYRNGRLIGAVGASGDGIDEDDSASFAGASVGFQPPPGIRCDEQDDHILIASLVGKLDRLVAAIQAHPDLRIRNVYGPLIAAERDRARTIMAAGFNDTRIPYVKLPRNPHKF